MQQQENIPGQPQAEDSKERTNSTAIPAQQRAEVIAYAVQSGVFSIAANLFEPYVNYQVQKYFSGSAAKAAHAHGNYTQNLIGEFAGDLIGSGALIAAETLFPEQLHSCMRGVRYMVSPVYDMLARKILPCENDKQCYEDHVQQWKTFQERNLARSAVMATAGIAGNLATQKWIARNPSPTKLIFAGKLASTALTTSLGLGVRMAFPDKMKSLDKWMGKNMFKSMLADKGCNEQQQSHVDSLNASRDAQIPERVH